MAIYKMKTTGLPPINNSTPPEACSNLRSIGGSMSVLAILSVSSTASRCYSKQASFFSTDAAHDAKQAETQGGCNTNQRIVGCLRVPKYEADALDGLECLTRMPKDVSTRRCVRPSGTARSEPGVGMDLASSGVSLDLGADPRPVSSWARQQHISFMARHTAENDTDRACGC